MPLAGLDPATVVTTTLIVVPGAIPEESVQRIVFPLTQVTLEQRPVVRVELGRKFVPLIWSTDPPTDGHPLSVKPTCAPAQAASVRLEIVGAFR